MHGECFFRRKGFVATHTMRIVANKHWLSKRLSGCCWHIQFVKPFGVCNAGRVESCEYRHSTNIQTQYLLLQYIICVRVSLNKHDLISRTSVQNHVDLFICRFPSCIMEHEVWHYGKYVFFNCDIPIYKEKMNLIVRTSFETYLLAHKYVKCLCSFYD